MKLRLRFALILLCVVLCTALSACGSITYSVQVASGGARTLTLCVNFDDTVSEQDAAYIKTFLEDVAVARNRNGRKCKVTAEEKYVYLKETFDSATEYYIAMGYTGNEPNDDPTPYVNLNAYFTEYVSEMSLATRATIISYAFKYAVGDRAQKGEGDLLTDWHNYCYSYADMTTNSLSPVYAALARADKDSLLAATNEALLGDNGDALAIALESWLAEKGYNLRDVEFCYTYEHVYKSVYAKQTSNPLAESDNEKLYTRSYKNSETGATVYEWDMSLADLPAATVTIYQKAPRAWAWELTAIAAGVVAMGVIITIILVKRRKTDDAARETGE